MKHSDVVLLDNTLRCYWYSPEPCKFPLSVGLMVSAKLKRVCKRVVVCKGVVQ